MLSFLLPRVMCAKITQGLGVRVLGLGPGFSRAGSFFKA